MSSTISSNRFVICPKCRNVLPEVPDLPLYQCAVCDTILFAKDCRRRGGSFASVDSVFNFIHTNEFDDGSETDSLYSYVESVPLGTDPAYLPSAGNKFDSKVERGKSGEILKNEGNELKIGAEAIMDEVHSHSTEAGIGSNTEDGCHETSKNLKNRGKEPKSQGEQCDEVIGPFAEQTTQCLNIQKDESEIGGDPIRRVESGTGDDAVRCLGGKLENNLDLGKVDTETQKSEDIKAVFVESTCQKSTPEENPAGGDLGNRVRSWQISSTKAGQHLASFDCTYEDNNLGKHHQLQSKRTFRPRNLGFPLASGHSSQELQGKTPATKQSKMQCGSDVMGCFNSVESKSSHGRHSHGCEDSNTSKQLLQNQPLISHQISQNIPGSPLSSHVPGEGPCLKPHETVLTPEPPKMQNRSDVMRSFDSVESGSSHGRNCYKREASGTSEELLPNEPFESQRVQSISDVMGSFTSVESSSSHGRHFHGREASGTSEELLENEPLGSKQTYHSVVESPLSEQDLGGGASHQELQETNLTAEQLNVQNKSHGRWHSHRLEASSVYNKLSKKNLFWSQQISRNDSPSSKFRDIEQCRIELLSKVDDLRFQLIGSLAHINGVDRKMQIRKERQARRWKKYTYCLNCHVPPPEGIFCNNGLCMSCCRMHCHDSNTARYPPKVIPNPHSSPKNLGNHNVMELQWKDQKTKRHCRPISGGANIITCPECLDILQMPDDFYISRKTSNKLRCGSCSQVLTLSFSKNSFRYHIF